MVEERALIELGRLLLEAPIRDEYASKVSDPAVLHIWSKWAADHLSSPHQAARFLTDLAYAGYKLVNAIVANPNTPPEALEVLADAVRRHSDSLVGSILARIATHPNTPASTLSILASPMYETYVRAAAALNPNTPPQILRDLLKSGSKYIRLSLAVNPATPPDVLTYLAKSTSQTLLNALASNKSAPPAVLFRLIQTDVWRSARVRALANPAFPESYFNMAVDAIYNSMRNHSASYPTIAFDNPSKRKPGTLRLDVSQMRTFISCPRLADERLTAIAETAAGTSNYMMGPYETYSVKMALLDNPNLPANYIELFLLDESSMVRDRAADRLAQLRRAG